MAVNTVIQWRFHGISAAKSERSFKSMAIVKCFEMDAFSRNDTFSRSFILASVFGDASFSLAFHLGFDGELVDGINLLTNEDKKSSRFFSSQSLSLSLFVCVHVLRMKRKM